MNDTNEKRVQYVAAPAGWRVWWLCDGEQLESRPVVCFALGEDDDERDVLYVERYGFIESLAYSRSEKGGDSLYDPERLLICVTAPGEDAPTMEAALQRLELVESVLDRRERDAQAAGA